MGDLRGLGRFNGVDIGRRDHYALVGRDVDALNTCHEVFSPSSTGLSWPHTPHLIALFPKRKTPASARKRRRRTGVFGKHARDRRGGRESQAAEAVPRHRAATHLTHPSPPLQGVISALTPSSPRSASCRTGRSEEHTSELQSLMRISYDVFCLKHK